MAYLALSTCFAVVHIPGNLDFAFMILETMGKKNEKFFRADGPDLREYQLVIDGNKGPSYLILVHADTFPHEHEQREKKPDNKSPDSAIKKKVFTPENRKYQCKTTTDQEQDNRGKNDRHDDGKLWMDISKAHIGN